MRRNFERRMRWQVVRVTDDVQRMLDAPILLVSSARPLTLTAKQWVKLREYTLRGGTLLLVATGGSESFLDSARKALADLYAPQRKLAGRHYALERLPAGHPVYTAYQKFPRGPVMAPMWGVSDGTRLLAILCARDLAAPWQRRMTTTRRDDFMLGANLFLYATDGNDLASRLRPVFPGADREPKYHVRVAWIRHNANWCSQPHALRYLSQKLTAENRVAIDLDVGACLTAKELRGRHLTWLTGSSKLELTAEEIEALRDWLWAGGTLFVNAAGGSREFNRSAEAMLARLLDGAPPEPVDVGSDSPLITGKCGEFRGPPIRAVPSPDGSGPPQPALRRTKALRLAVPDPAPPLKVYTLDGRVAVIHAPFGIHDTLDGHTAAGARSYMPDAARDLAANVVLLAFKDHLAAGAATRPADGP
jgi:hypothetical protein